MKKIIFGIVALLIATFGLYAFSNANFEKKISDDEPVLFWFDDTGNPMLQGATQAQQQSQCGSPGSINCAHGYASVDEEGEPEGPIIKSTTKKTAP